MQNMKWKKNVEKYNKIREAKNERSETIAS